MPTRGDTAQPEWIDRPPETRRTMTPSMAWAELSILEAKQMATEALRIVAQSRDICRRSSDQVRRAAPSDASKPD